MDDYERGRLFGHAQGMKAAQERLKKISSDKEAYRDEDIIFRFRPECIDGKTTDEIAAAINMDISYPSSRGKACPEIIILAHNLTLAGYSRKQARRGGRVIRVWRAPVIVTFSNEPPV